jgi:hypothetical protein
MRRDEPESGFFQYDGAEIAPDLIVKLSLCVSRRKDDDLDEYIPCTLTRSDQEEKEVFRCYAIMHK